MKHEMDAVELAVYTQLLGIPAQGCPPDYYTLLGLQPGQHERSTIDKAAKAQATRLRKDIPHELYPAALGILKTISKARKCLSDDSARASYDQLIGLQPAIDSEELALETKDSLSENKQELSAPLELDDSFGTPPSLSELPSLDEEPNWLEAELATMPTASPKALSAIVEAEEDTSSDKNVLPWIIGGVTGITLLAVLVTLVVSSFFGEGSDSKEVVAAQPPVSSPLPSDPPRISQSTSEAEPSTSLPIAEAIPSERATPRTARGSISSGAMTKRIASATSEPSANTTDETNPVESTPVPQSPVPATDQDVLELKAAVSLPSNEKVYGDSPATSGPKTVSLGVVSPDLESDLEFTVIAPERPDASGNWFQVEKVKDTPGGRIWVVRVSLAATPEEGEQRSALASHRPTHGGMVAGLRFRQGELEFAWGRGGDRSTGAQLRNSALLVSSGLQQGRVGLSLSNPLDPLVLNLEEKKQTLEFPHSPLPPEPALRCCLVESSFDGLTTEIDPPTGQFACGESLTVSVLDWRDGEWTGEIEVRVRFSAAKDDQSARLTVSPRFKFGRSWKPLQAEKIESALNQASVDLRKARSQLSAATDAVRSLPSRITSLRSAVSNDSNPNLVRQLASAQAALKSARSRGTRLVRSIPKIEEGIGHLRQLEGIRAKMNERASLQFRVYVQLEEGELDLYVPAGDAAGIHANSNTDFQNF